MSGCHGEMDHDSSLPSPQSHRHIKLTGHVQAPHKEKLGTLSEHEVLGIHDSPHDKSLTDILLSPLSICKSSAS